MNHIYRSLWSECLNTWIAVSEKTKGKAKSSQSSLCFALLFCSASVWALPTGEQVVAGQAQVMPNAGQMQILQTTPQAIINWQNFSIQPNESVRIQQPSFNATLLNRVIGADASLIQGQLSANGQVFLLNPSGVLFSQSAQVDVGGLIASTHTLSNSDFLNGNYHFSAITTGDSRVGNEGTIRVPEGGIVALIGSQVSNSGTITTPKGSTVLAAGKTVDLDLQGAGLVEVKVSESALQAQIDNKGVILADGGRVILTAQAAGDLTHSVINHSGLIQAKSLVERNGEIVLAGGDNGITQVSGQINTSGQTSGGKINITGKNVTIQDYATLTAQATDSGTAGSILVLGNMQNGTLNVAGKLDASAPKTGDGGFIETSAARVNVADAAQITTKAQQGKSGTWLLDPADIIIAPKDSNITGAALSNALSRNNVTLYTTDTKNNVLSSCDGCKNQNNENTFTPIAGKDDIGTKGDIFVADTVSWSNSKLTLQADGNIYINKSLTGGNLTLDAKNIITSSNDGQINLSGNNFNFTANGGDIGIISQSLNVKDLSLKAGKDVLITGNSNTEKITLTADNHIVLNKPKDSSHKMVGQAITLNAGNNIYIDLPVTGQNLTLNYAQNNKETFTELINNNPVPSPVDYYINAPVDLVAFSTQKYPDSSDKKIITSYTVINSLNNLNKMEDARNINTNYALAANTAIIDATETKDWNNGDGFRPFGNNFSNYKGTFDGLGHTINNLTVDGGWLTGKSNSNNPTIRDIKLNNITITGKSSLEDFTGKSPAYFQDIRDISGVTTKAGQRNYDNITGYTIRNVTVKGNQGHIFFKPSATGKTIENTTATIYSNSSTNSTVAVTQDTKIEQKNESQGSQVIVDNTEFSQRVIQENSKSLVQPVFQAKNQAGKVKRLQLSANKRFLSLLLEDSSIRIWDFERGVQRVIPIKNSNRSLIDISAVDEKGDFLSIASTSRVKTYNILSASPDKKLTILKPNIRQFVNSDDGNLLLVATDSGELSLWNNPQNKQQWHNPTQHGDIMDLALDKQNRYAAIVRQSKTYELSGNLRLRSLTDAIDIIELNTGNLVKSLPNTGENIVSIQFQAADTLQIALANGDILHWSVTSNEKKTVTAFGESITAVDSAGGNYAYLLHDGTLRVRSSDGQVLWSAQNADNPFQEAKLIANGKKLLTVLASGDMALWDVASGKKILRLFSSKQGWTVMDAFGRFDGSEEAMENFSWLADEVDIPLDSFSENYYEPGLLAELASDKNALSNNPSSVQDGITLPPKLNLQLATEQNQRDKVVVQVDVYDRGGGIDKVSFYHNGRLVPPENQRITQKSADHQVLTLSVTPTTGKNSLNVTASNTMGIESNSKLLYFDFDGKKPSVPKLRLLSVGINQYQDRNLNLNYSVADANAIAQQLSKNATNLTNEQATKARILAELKTLSAGEQHDVLVLYLSGHGVAVGKEWYFLPYESQMPENPEQKPTGAISATELDGIFKQSKIQNILFVVDSCYSGASMEAFTTLEHKQRSFTRQLSRSLGITVITATAKDQVAPELAKLKHGLFTYQLLEELKKTTEKAVTAHSVAKDISNSLPKFSKQAVGIIQEPAVYKNGSDFELLIKTR